MSHPLFHIRLALGEKICSVCGLLKKLDDFHTCSKNKDGKTEKCRECKNAQGRANKEKRQIYLENNRDRTNATRRIYAQTESGKMAFKKYFNKNKTHIMKMQRENLKKRRESDIALDFGVKVRSGISAIFRKKGMVKPCRSLQILGMDMDSFKVYIERQFTKGMTWDNYGIDGWHLDHKIPLASAKTKEDVLQLCHYTNMQPMWWRENIVKSNKIIPHQLKITL